MAINHSYKNGIATITINRPEKLNALDPSHLQQLRTHIAHYDAMAEVRVIILTGGGEKAFCVGADLTSTIQESSVAESFSLNLEQSGERGFYIRLFDFSSLKRRKPLIAAINGYCLGGGLEIALQCDLMIASETAQFGLPEVIVSSLPGAGGVPNLLRSIPRAQAMHMLLTGERIDAHRALGIGLISALYKPDLLNEAALALATKIADNGPIAVQLVKMLADQASGIDNGQAIQMTELAWGLLRDSEDRLEGRRAFGEKRKPRYRGQ